MPKTLPPGVLERFAEAEKATKLAETVETNCRKALHEAERAHRASSAEWSAAFGDLRKALEEMAS